MPSMKLLDAFKLAATLHAGDVDQNGRPYIEHLSRVFIRVLEQGGKRDQQIAALLYSAIGDGHATQDSLLEMGVPRTAVDLIAVLTRREGQSYLDYIRGVLARDRAVLVKRCVLADNLDEERLNVLTPQVSQRLKAKYGGALSILSGEVEAA